MKNIEKKEKVQKVDEIVIRAFFSEKNDGKR